jgi:hypothetical protein
VEEIAAFHGVNDSAPDAHRRKVKTGTVKKLVAAMNSRWFLANGFHLRRVSSEPGILPVRSGETARSDIWTLGFISPAEDR